MKNTSNYRDILHPKDESEKKESQKAVKLAELKSRLAKYEALANLPLTCKQCNETHTLYEVFIKNPDHPPAYGNNTCPKCRTDFAQIV